MSEMTSNRDRMRGALWGLFVGDALAMPVHWYYDVAAIRRDFGTIRDYQSPQDFHPNSIMKLASTGRAGRGTQEGDVVGEVILKGKKHLWGRPNRHYHHGLEAGDNTLNLLCVRVLLRTLAATGRYDADAYLRNYIDFMTAADSHRDTYAESYHRDFFANVARGIAPEDCAGPEGHDTASIGGLVALPTVIIAALSTGDPAAVSQWPLTHLRLTHRSEELARHARVFANLFQQLLEEPASRVKLLVCEAAAALGFPAAKVIERVERDGLSDLEVIGRLLSPACYIDQSFPAVLYLAGRYADDLEDALIANTHVGGDNCHRGAVLGALLGAAHGIEAIPRRWIEGLRSRADLEREIESFLGRLG